ncbi:MAG: OsmC family protein [Oculatellaceae cyanobacterium Prado106]|nr:OsmC family protein [Oculatellaceae cyanobacterium Prado106]
MVRDKTHRYQTQVLWTGNQGQGTANYRAYERSHQITKTQYNPEELLVASLSACHMLWYLHLCAEAAIVVTHYIDQAIGTLQETEEGGGRFTEVVLHPIVTVKLNDF